MTMIILTILLALVILKLNQPMMTDNAKSFVECLAKATQQRYATEYLQLRSVEISNEVFLQHMHLISPCTGLMNTFNYLEFKAAILKAIENSDKVYRAELCFIHDLMIEEYHKLIPKKKTNYELGINEFYNLFRTSL